MYGFKIIRCNVILSDFSLNKSLAFFSFLNGTNNYIFGTMQMLCVAIQPRYYFLHTEIPSPARAEWNVKQRCCWWTVWSSAPTAIPTQALLCSQLNICS